MEPMKIDHLGIENQAGNIRIKGAFTNVINSGASNFTVKEVRSDLNVSERRKPKRLPELNGFFFLQKLRVDLGLFIPHIKSKGRYEVNGQVLLLPILSHGDFYAEFSEKNFWENVEGSN